MNNDNWPTLDDLAAKWSKDPEHVLAEFRLKPYFTVAKDIFELRQEMKLTQEQLAERAQTHQSRISKAESADLDFKLSTLIKIAEALGAHVDVRVVMNVFASDEEYRALFSMTATTRPERASLQEIRPEIMALPQTQMGVANA